MSGSRGSNSRKNSGNNPVSNQGKKKDKDKDKDKTMASWQEIESDKGVEDFFAMEAFRGANLEGKLDMMMGQ